MADRLMVITGLGALATQAALDGDDRLAVLARGAIELLMTDGAAVAELERRRTKDRNRKPAANPRIPRIPRNSKESTDSTEFQAGSLSPVLSPTPPLFNPSLSRSEESAGARDEATERTTALVTAQCPADHWPACDAFLKRRPYTTWNGWLKAFLECGQTWGWDCLAAVCTDDEALTRPVGSPKGLRIFVASTHRERTAKPAASGSNAKPSAQGGARNDAVLDEWLAKKQAQRKVANGQ